jgi:hypothetical protein
MPNPCYEAEVCLQQTTDRNSKNNKTLQVELELGNIQQPWRTTVSLISLILRRVSQIYSKKNFVP